MPIIMVYMVTTTRKAPDKRTILHMKIDPMIKAKLARVAKEQNRTLSNLIETILRDHAGDK